MSDRSPVVNALVGAAVSVVLAVLPFSTMLGGAVAGYLEGGDLGRGLRVGALAGLFAAIPLALVLFVLGAVLSVGMLGLGLGRLAAAGGLLAVVILLFATVYLVGFSAIGGAVGALVRGDPDLDPTTE